MPAFLTKKYKATTEGGGSIEFMLWSDEVRHMSTLPESEHLEYLLHQAWRALWRTDAAAMLRKLCDKQGADKVMETFNKHTEIKEITG